MTAAPQEGAVPPAGPTRPAGAGPGRLELRGVTKRYGPITALESLDLSVMPGEFITLLGPSGCGKTTALNCLAGLLGLSAGEIWLDGRRIDGLPAERRGFGMVFQNYALFPHLTARRNVAFGLEVRGLAREQVRRRTNEALALVRLEQHADRHPGQLSGGQQQRVAIARALVMEPRLLLMDEPLSNLDTKLRGELRTEIKRLHQSLGLTTIYVTHDQGEALSLSDRLVLMRDGLVQQIGTPPEVHAKPASAFVADFMGYRNLVPVEVVAVENGQATVQAPGLVLRGTAIGPVRAGGHAIAAVRPEDIACRRGGDGPIRGRVDVVEFQGDSLAADIVVEGGQRLYAVSSGPLSPGDLISLDVAPHRLLVYPAEGEARP